MSRTISIRLIILLVLIVAIFAGVPLQMRAAVPSSDVHVLQLQADLAKLRQEVEALRDRVSALEHSPAIVAAKPKTVAEQNAGEKGYASLKAIMDEMPKELLPLAGAKWDQFNAAKPSEWVVANMKGRWVVIDEKVTKQFSVTDDAGVWYLGVQFTDESFSFHGLGVKFQRICPGHSANGRPEYKIPISEATAKRIQKEHLVFSLKVRAQITEVSPLDVQKGSFGGSESRGLGHMQVYLANFVLLGMTPPLSLEPPVAK